MDGDDGGWSDASGEGKERGSNEITPAGELGGEGGGRGGSSIPCSFCVSIEIHLKPRLIAPRIRVIRNIFSYK